MEAYQRSCDAINTAVGYMQTMRVADVRQTLDFLGVHHTEVIVGLCMFILIQFTRFTAVLLIAIAIAFAIFYMWDTYFPELSRRPSLERTYNVRPYLDFFRPEYQDARTLARLPPFSYSPSNNSDQELFGDQNGSKNNPGYSTRSSGHTTPTNNRNLMTPIVRSNVVTTQTSNRGSGMTTPYGHLGTLSGNASERRSKNVGSVNQQSQQGNRFEDRPSRRPLSNNEYDYYTRRGSPAGTPEHRSGRSTVVPQSNRQPPQYQDENRSRRPTGSNMHDESRPTRNRRSNRDRPSIAKRQITSDFNDNARGAYERRLYSMPPSNLNRFSIVSGGTHYIKSDQYSNTIHRSNPERDTRNQKTPRSRKTPLSIQGTAHPTETDKVEEVPICRMCPIEKQINFSQVSEPPDDSELDFSDNIANRKTEYPFIVEPSSCISLVCEHSNSSNIEDNKNEDGQNGSKGLDFEPPIRVKILQSPKYVDETERNTNSNFQENFKDEIYVEYPNVIEIPVDQKSEMKLITTEKKNS